MAIGYKNLAMNGWNMLMTQAQMKEDSISQPVIVWDNGITFSYLTCNLTIPETSVSCFDLEDAILSVQELPLSRWDSIMTVLSLW